MTHFEWTLLPIGLSIVGLLLLASFFRSHWLALVLSMGGLAGSAFFNAEHPLSIFVLFSAFAVIWLEKSFVEEEFKILVLSSTLGALLCLQSENWISLFLGIELMTLPIYGLIAFKSVPAAIKYLLLAGASSAFMLFGMALCYAQSRSMAFSLESSAGGLLLFSGICFKLSLVPFHFWTPDVYEQAPLRVTAFLAIVSKIAFVGILTHLHPESGLRLILIGIAGISMFCGSLLLLKTDRLTRFLAYSSVAHMGYVLMAWLTQTNPVFYVGAYAASLLVIFVAISLEKHRQISMMLLVLGLLSLMGLPLTPIFWGKYQIIFGLLSDKNWILCLTLVVSSLLGVYGYARLIARTYQGSEQR